MEETWYIQITRYFENGKEERTLYMTDVCAKEFSSKEATQKFIKLLGDEWLDTEYNPRVPNEIKKPTYKPITANMFDTL